MLVGLPELPPPPLLEVGAVVPQYMFTSSKWLQSSNPYEFLEQELSLVSVPKQLTLSNQIGPLPVPNLQSRSS